MEINIRVYLMLLGINQPDAASDIDAYTRGWLYMGSPTNHLNGVSYNPDVTGYSKREMVFDENDRYREVVSLLVTLPAQ